ncbi:MAG: UDP-glucose/GDP-mannose dehydrogenase family protein [Desulfobulbaceae bacterium]|nr:UDP-glucose/GDP-mannose dehydrogenase family protein [Candidatus Kapabacteria bacterium]MBS4000621.1 UDP-glucose/GDP-mannose dehydrogenase family protein [Desulfobulbaceae bacterium]
MSYEIAVIGTGYVGLVTGTCFASTGIKVICVDIDERKVEMMQNGICPIFEPGLEPLLVKNLRDERLHFSTDLESAVENASVIFLCLPTPPNEDGSADLQHVQKVASDIAFVLKNKNINDKKIIVNKSTVPVGTSDVVKAIFDKILPDNNVTVASNPEFLREGFAVEDAMKPERIVIGTSDSYTAKVLRDLYQPFVRSGNPIYVMDEKSSELTKYAANAFLATKISFMNDLSAYCEAVGADIEKIRIGIGSDTRIGKRFLFAGIGYGGSCFPKDVRALMYSAQAKGIELDIVKASYEVNDKQIRRFFKTISDKYEGKLAGLRFALWGLAFKPNTDDTREAPAHRLIELMLEKGAEIIAFDPEAIENTKVVFGDKIVYSANMYDALEGADALIIATEWNEFRNPDLEKISSLLKQNIIFDGRNLFEPSDMKELGFEYYCIGRK